jgi:glycosyltransferase involved in cell wall biosynthesis
MDREPATAVHRTGTVVVASNTTWYLYNFRRGLIRGLLEHGHEVVIVSPEDEYSERLRQEGCRFIGLPLDNKGTNPVADFCTFLHFLRTYRRMRPLLVFHNTIKPVIYGSLAARCLGIPTINTVTGLGSVFSKRGMIQKIVCCLYKFSQARAKKIFFQNHEDMMLFMQQGLVPTACVERIPGSGVDISRFRPSPKAPGESTVFLMVSRMLWEKGVGEFVAAARLMRERHPSTCFRLLGYLDVESPTAIPHEQMEQWMREGGIEYLGSTDDVPTAIAQADCVVLPSYYREGVPKCLLEGAAMEKPLIATDNVGCHDVVVDGKNGFLCRPRDVQDLVRAMERLLSLSADQRAELGRAGREKVQREFDENVVVRQYLSALTEALA